MQWLSGEGSRPGGGQVVELWEAKLKVRSGSRHQAGLPGQRCEDEVPGGDLSLLPDHQGI